MKRNLKQTFFIRYLTFDSFSVKNNPNLNSSDFLSVVTQTIH